MARSSACIRSNLNARQETGQVALKTRRAGAELEQEHCVRALERQVDQLTLENELSKDRSWWDHRGGASQSDAPSKKSVNLNNWVVGGPI